MTNRQHKLMTIAAACFLILAFIGATSGTAHAQTNAQKTAQAEQLFDESIKLFQTGTAESFQASLVKFDKARQLFREINDKQAEATCLLLAGNIYNVSGNKQKALEYYAQASSLVRAFNDQDGEAILLNNIGLIYSELGEKQKALEYYAQSLPLLIAVDNKGVQAVTLNNIGLVYSDLGENQKALEYFIQTLPLFKAVNDKNGEATTFNNIGGVYDFLGEKQKSLEYYAQALPIYKTISDKRGEARTLSNIGKVYSDLGENQKALEYYAQALQLWKNVGDKRGEAMTLNNIGAVYHGVGENQKALEYFTQALPLRRATNDKRGEAITLTNIGTVYSKLGENQKALEYSTRTLPLFRAVGDKSSEALTLEGLMFGFNIINNPRYAAIFGKLSVNTRQLLRSNISGLDKNVQQSYLKSVEYTYRYITNFFIENNRLAEAQQILNLFKDQQYFDFNSAKQTAPLALTPREAAFISVFDKKLDSIAAVSSQLDELRRTTGNRQPTTKENAELKRLETDLQKVNNDYLDFLKTSAQEFAAPPSDKDKIPVVADTQQMQTALRELSAQTGEKSVAVYTLVGTDTYRALVVTADSISAVSTPIKGAALNEKARQLWRLLRTPEFDPQPLAKEVYDAVFAPLAAKLPADTKTILWSLDGSLRYVPMAALHDGKQYLVERYNNVVFTRADKERLTRNVSANLTGTGFGSSLLHKVRYGDKVFNARALPAVKTELARIFKSGSSTTGILSGETLLDAKFTRSAMISTLQKRRPLVHIASHFKFEAGDEANSFLLLGDGTVFTLDEMKQRKDLFAGVELLALSACDTAAQQADATGREVDGFAELAQRLGAGAVMASLWAVQDESTAELMARFYKNYNGQKGANKASALRSAQIALLSGEYITAGAVNRQLTRKDAETAEKFKIDITKQKLFDNAKNPKYAHPFFWSPFILIGNWK